MKGRLVIAIVSTLIEEVALALIVLLLLPRFDIIIPLWVLIVVMVAWLVYTVTTYRMGSRALKRKPVHGLTVMAGSIGEVVSSLTPRGMVRIRGELWQARSVGESITVGEEITVLDQSGLELVVCRRDKQGAVAD